MKKQTGQTALNKVRKIFPQVTSVHDSTRSVQVTVTKQDNSSARRKNPQDCALARACIREGRADGAIIGIAYSYLIKGHVATRYKTSPSVAREIVSFDRHHDFAAGKDYTLSIVAPQNRLGADSHIRHRKNSKTRSTPTRAVHRTENIRVMEK